MNLTELMDLFTDPSVLASLNMSHSENMTLVDVLLVAVGLNEEQTQNAMHLVETFASFASQLQQHSSQSFFSSSLSGMDLFDLIDMLYVLTYNNESLAEQIYQSLLMRAGLNDDALMHAISLVDTLVNITQASMHMTGGANKTELLTNLADELLQLAFVYLENSTALANFNLNLNQTLDMASVQALVAELLGNVSHALDAQTLAELIADVLQKAEINQNQLVPSLVYLAELVGDVWMTNSSWSSLVPDVSDLLDELWPVVANVSGVDLAELEQAIATVSELYATWSNSSMTLVELLTMLADEPIMMTSMTAGGSNETLLDAVLAFVATEAHVDVAHIESLLAIVTQLVDSVKEMVGAFVSAEENGASMLTLSNMSQADVLQLIESASPLLSNETMREIVGLVDTLFGLVDDEGNMTASAEELLALVLDALHVDASAAEALVMPALEWLSAEWANMSSLMMDESLFDVVSATLRDLVGEVAASSGMHDPLDVLSFLENVRYENQTIVELLIAESGVDPVELQAIETLVHAIASPNMTIVSWLELVYAISFGRNNNNNNGTAAASSFQQHMPLIHLLGSLDPAEAHMLLDVLYEVYKAVEAHDPQALVAYLFSASFVNNQTLADLIASVVAMQSGGAGGGGMLDQNQLVTSLLFIVEFAQDVMRNASMFVPDDLVEQLVESVIERALVKLDAYPVLKELLTVFLTSYEQTDGSASSALASLTSIVNGLAAQKLVDELKMLVGVLAPAYVGQIDHTNDPNVLIGMLVVSAERSLNDELRKLGIVIPADQGCMDFTTTPMMMSTTAPIYTTTSAVGGDVTPPPVEDEQLLNTFNQLIQSGLNDLVPNKHSPTGPPANLIIKA